MLIDKIRVKIDEIALYFLYVKKENLPPGLFSGSAGIALFLFYYYRYSKNEFWAEKAMQFLSLALDNIKEPFDYTFCSGISGICWCIQHLSQNKFIDSENLDIIKCFDKYLCDRSIYAMREEKNNDFLHGPIGASLYLLKRTENPKVIIFQEEIIKILYNNKTQIGNSYCWKSKIGNEYNISISHGMASISIFLSMAYRLNINQLFVKDLLEKSTLFFLNQEIESSERTSMFPTYALVDKNDLVAQKSRLGWCYGDLCIALAIWHYSLSIYNDEIKKKAIEIFLFSAERKDLYCNKVFDGGICHGTAGIALIFRRMYLNTGMIEFKEAFNYWIEQTLLMSKYPEAPVGYKANMKTDSIGFLEGISGIGLVLLSFFEKEDTHWDECLLLS